MRSGFPRAAAALLALAAGSCALPVETSAERAFLAGDERGAIEAYSRRLEQSDTKRRALDSNLLATAALVGGDLDRARRAFIDAGRIQGSFPSEQVGAIIGSEGSKIWLGDPYEKAMNSLYTAFALLAGADEENARAALKAGILADGGSEEEQYQSDIAALFLLEAWLSLRAGKEDLARQDLEQVRLLIPDCPLADENRLREANTVFLVDIGDGPQKVRTGRHGEMATFVLPPLVVSSLSMELGGEPIPPALGVDVGFQATTRGGRAMEGILKGKAVMKDVTAAAGILVLDHALDTDSSGGAALAGGLLLLSAMTRAEADIRHWHLLPSYTYLWIGRVEPGLHDLDIEFRGSESADAGSHELPEYRQVWHHLPFVDGRINAYYFRSGPRRGFGHAEEGIPAGNPADAERGSP